MKLFKQKEGTILMVILLFFTCIFCSISLVNHYQYRTYALDLGMFNHAVYLISKFSQPVFTLGLDGTELHYLGTHFSLITYLYFPFSYLFGSYTLLIIQIVSILSGGLAAYKYAQLKFQHDSILPVIIIIQFFCIWGIYSALSFDFHNNILGAMFMIWLIYFLEKRNLKAAWGFLLLAVFTQESIALWSIFVLIGLMIKNRKEFRQYYIKFEIPALILCIVYTVVVVMIIMPAFQNTENNLQLTRYSHLGGSVSEIVSKIIQHPKYIFSLLFESTVYDEITFGIKSELHFMVLISGGFALIYRPAFLFMLLPVYAQKLLSNDYGFWGINLQYSIEYVPILSICLIEFISGFKSKKYMYSLALITTCSTAFYTYKTIESRRSIWYNKTNTAFYESGHYQSALDISEINSALKTIPDNASVSASPALAPHIACRTKLYHFPIVKDAAYIVLITAQTSTYPLNEEEYLAKTKEYVNNEQYNINYQSTDLIILKRK